MEGVFTSNLETVNKYVSVESNHEVKEAFGTMQGLGESLEKKARVVQLIELVQSGHLSIEIASETAGMTVEEFEDKMRKLSVAER